ncbi:MAG TPA: HAMP domain-containing sensor histidine kinase [Candidatus Binatia bacterium]|nr:HAMP domain-containing sensor histidine kinase [Candidatus Binatia bacterium]
MAPTAEPTAAVRRIDTLILLRWVLIIATSYLLLFSRLEPAGAGVALFVAGYFASNLVLAHLLPRVRSRHTLDVGVVLVDTGATSVALALTGNAGSEFFLFYFLILFIAALSDRLHLVVTAALLAGVVHVMTLARVVALNDLLQSGYLLRIPFFVVAALFFGHLVEDEAHARERTRLEFVSTVSHDLKNPLAVIQSIADLLLDGHAGALTPDQAQFVRRIHASAHHLITLSHNLLNVERIEAGHLRLRRAPENLARLVENAIDFARCGGDLKGITLELTAVPNPPPVNVDAVYMERVVANLLDNAIKFTPRGGRVRATVEREPEALVLRVADNGPGIAPADLPKLFEKYHLQARASRGGAGFGLFIVRAIVEAHGGTVEIGSEVDRGTTVTVRLPIASPREPSRPPGTRWKWRVAQTGEQSAAPV